MDDTKKIDELKMNSLSPQDIQSKLNEEKIWFESMVLNIPGIIYRCEPYKDWNMHYISDAIEEISGYPVSDFINNNKRTFASIIHPEDTLLVEEIIFDALAKKASYTIEYRIIDSRKKIRWVYEKGRGVFGDNNQAMWLDGGIFEITSIKKNEKVRENLICKLKKALSDIKKLSGMLPICSSCKKIRNDNGYWTQIESYISEHSEAQFSHGICSECSDKLYDNEEWYIKMKNKRNQKE